MARLALGGELLEEHVLHEVGLDVVADGDALLLRPLVEVVAPADELAYGGLTYEGAQVPQLAAAGLAPELGGFVVVLLCALPRGVDVEEYLLEVAPCRATRPAYPLGAEDGAFDDGVVHVLFLEGAVALELFDLAHFVACPLGCPRDVAVAVEDVDAADADVLDGAHGGKHAGLADEVADHDEATAASVERAEEGFLDPVGELADARGVLAELVVVEVVDDDVVGARGAVAQTAGALAAATGEEGGAVFGDELSFFPGSAASLLAVVGDVALVVLELGLEVGEQGAGVVLALADEDHDAQLALLLGLEPQGDEDVEVGGFGCTAVPLVDGAEVLVSLYLFGRLNMEGGAGGVLPCTGVDGIVGEVVVDEGGVVAAQTTQTALALAGSLAGAQVGGLLHVGAVLLPLLKGFAGGELVVFRHVT